MYTREIPDEVRDELTIPSKWEIGGPCPNCQQAVDEGRKDKEDMGVLELADLGEHRDVQVPIHEWGDSDGTRFDIVCSEWRSDDGHCDFAPYSTGQLTPTIADDWDEPY